MSAPATVLRDVLREVAMPELKPRPAPIRRGPLDWYDYKLEDFWDSGWSLNVGYRWDRESDEDRIEVDIVALELWTPAGTTAIDPSAFKDADRERVEDAIREEVEAREQAERDDRHPSSCRCRDCRDDRGEWEYEQRRDREAL